MYLEETITRNALRNGVAFFYLEAAGYCGHFNSVLRDVSEAVRSAIRRNIIPEDLKQTTKAYADDLAAELAKLEAARAAIDKDLNGGGDSDPETAGEDVDGGGEAGE